MFAAIRHPDLKQVGMCPQGAFEFQRVRGWFRVSPWVADPAELHLPDFDEAFDDLDAPQTTSPAEPEKDEEQ